VEVLASLVLIAGWSDKTTFNKELLISSFTLYSTKPNLRNLFMKKGLVRLVRSTDDLDIQWWHCYSGSALSNASDCTARFTAGRLVACDWATARLSLSYPKIFGKSEANSWGSATVLGNLFTLDHHPRRCWRARPVDRGGGVHDPRGMSARHGNQLGRRAA
jgi:hypothetical protein